MALVADNPTFLAMIVKGPTVWKYLLNLNGSKWFCELQSVHKDLELQGDWLARFRLYKDRQFLTVPWAVIIISLTTSKSTKGINGLFYIREKSASAMNIKGGKRTSCKEY